MANQSTNEKCIECGQTGHGSTACNNGRVATFNLFGVKIDPKTVERRHGKEKEVDHVDNGVGNLIRKCKSMQILNVSNNDNNGSMDRGYLSDGHHDHKKKGMPWTEDEHRSFLTGLEKLGKGDWRGISKNYVPTRTPTQVASHAQKYFIRLNVSQEKAKRRSSLFDMPFNESPSVPTAPVAPIPPAPINPGLHAARPPISHMSRPYHSQDYGRMNMGYQNSNIEQQSSNDPKCSAVISFIPVVSFPNQGRVFPLNNGWTQRLMTRAPFVPQPYLPITPQGEQRITEVIDVDMT
uniref:probable transcription factor At5g61620 n=1 Tax=Erigeron canadensis TaxID=72917 RepID=UPI001CB8C334|nr:probable transcription factor At5g61620 [Erigeron canadensis]